MSGEESDVDTTWTDGDERAARILAVRHLWPNYDRPVTEHDIELAGRDSLTRQLVAVAKAATLAERARWRGVGEAAGRVAEEWQSARAVRTTLGLAQALEQLAAALPPDGKGRP